jgi:hypothetical protein
MMQPRKPLHYYPYHSLRCFLQLARGGHLLLITQHHAKIVRQSWEYTDVQHSAGRIIGIAPFSVIRIDDLGATGLI